MTVGELRQWLEAGGRERELALRDTLVSGNAVPGF
jgi:hypothetical protein